MASLGLKLYYLRTREKKLSQRGAARELGIRQGTLSFLEQGTTAPHLTLLIDLCRFYDVTPTFLVDEKRTVVPLPVDRWGLRDSLVTVGMWIEVNHDSVHELGNNKVLCQLEPDGAFFDEEAAAVRRRYKREGNSRPPLLELQEQHRAEERALEAALRRELTEHPRRRAKPAD